MRVVRRLAAATLFATAAALTGCGGSDGHTKPTLAEAEVVVTVNDQPLPFAEVTFTPTDPKYGSAAIASGVTDEAGRVKLSSGGKPGACVGANKVTVSEGPPPEAVRGEGADAQKADAQYQRGLKNRPIPPKYATLAKSDLTVEVKKDQKEYPIKLSR